jgi:hypothetical protein
MDPGTLSAMVVAALAPYLVKAGSKVSEKAGEKAFDQVGKLWTFIVTKLRDRPSVDEAVTNFAAHPADEDAQAIFQIQLKRSLAESPLLAYQLQDLLTAVTGDAIRSNESSSLVHGGSGAIASDGGVAAGAGGLAIGGNVGGNAQITIGEHGPSPRSSGQAGTPNDPSRG